MKYIFTFLIIVIGLNAFGAWVPVEKAKKVAEGTIASFAPDYGTEASFTVEEISTNIPGPDAAYYIARLQPRGFILISAEDLAYPVLGFSFEQAFPSGPMPEHIASWMLSYEKQIDELRDAEVRLATDMSNAWQSFKNAGAKKEVRSVEPLLISTWNQGNYYNGMCPEDPAGPGGRVYAGCVATAMAQVMYYYRYPQAGTGNSSYWHPQYGQLSANYGNTTYRWNEMLSDISSPNNAMAELLYHCAVSVEMMFSPSGSGAYSSDAAAAYRNYFGYSSSTQLEYKDNYTEQAWKDLLKGQLDAGKPMYYHGYGSGGHAFNVDGYQGNDHFHFNWGWSGSYNGYYYLDNLNPGGSDFTNGQGAIINIEPAGTYPSYCTGMHTLTALTGTFEDGSGPISDYQAGANCSWLIAPQQNPEDTISSISILFERFETEDQADWVTIYQGASASNPVLAKFSGNSLPGRFTIDGNQALITFTSNNTNEDQGFIASYSAAVPDFCSKTPETYTDSTGTLSDGSGGKSYNNRSICHWTIEPPGADAVVLSFSEFDTEPQNDFLEVYQYEPTTGNGTLLGRFSGTNLPPTITSNSGAMFLTFFTNADETRSGWKASYNTSAVGLEEYHGIELDLWPNPAGDELFIQNIKGTEDQPNLRILDMNGRIQLDKQLGSGNEVLQLDISDLPQGIYIVELKDGNDLLRRKLIKK